MKQRLIIISFCCSLLICQDLFSQTDLRPGYIITNENDTVYGLVDYRGDIRNSEICVFKKQEGSEPAVYQPFDIKGYRFTDDKYYISKSVVRPDGELKIFAEYLVDGIADLYYFRQNDGDHYLIEKEDMKLYELTNEVTMITINHSTYRHETKKYIGLLKASFADSREILPQVNKARLGHKSLINLTTKYHDYVCDDEKCIIYQKPLPRVRLKIAPVAGFSLSHITFLDDEIYSPIKMDNAYYLSAGFLLDASLPRQSEKLSLQISSRIGKCYFYGFHEKVGWFNVTDNTVRIHTYPFNNSLALKYTYPTGKFRPTFACGGSFNYFLDLDALKTTVIRYPSIEDEGNSTYTSVSAAPVPQMVWGGFTSIGTGFNIKNIDIFSELTYEFNRKHLFPFGIINTNMHTIGISLGIYL